ncbi:MAG: biopolymer transporter ExbD [Gammaproteobacteria bacterium]|nr:biopolymer transporter ExbD [Gammaproteobacteria bacterium]
MSMNVKSDDEEEHGIMSEINTTPLVDIMLVLLIIFLITIPIITKTVPLTLPKVANIPTKTKPENITISVDPQGQIWWNGQLVPDRDALIKKVVVEAVKVPQPEVHIRGDAGVRYEAIGRTLYAIQRGGLTKVGFITEPDRSLGR